MNRIYNDDYVVLSPNKRFCIFQWDPSASVLTPITTRTGVCAQSMTHTTSCTASSSQVSSAITT